MTINERIFLVDIEIHIYTRANRKTSIRSVYTLELIQLNVQEDICILVANIIYYEYD